MFTSSNIVQNIISCSKTKTRDNLNQPITKSLSRSVDARVYKMHMAAPLEHSSEQLAAQPHAGRLDRALPDLIALTTAAGLFSIFCPGLLSNDSIAQYHQAIAGQYDNWHPPIMAICLSAALHLGGSVAWLMLIQCFAGVIGVRFLSAGVLELLFAGRISRRQADWISVAVLLILLTPLSPLQFYLMTFWKDCWAMVLLLWIAGGSIRLYLRATELSRGAFVLAVAALLAGMTLFGMVRHNAIVSLPILGMCLWACLRRRKVPLAILAAIAPVVLMLACDAAVVRMFNVQKRHITNCILALDLVGLCVQDESHCKSLPFTSAHLRPGYRWRYRWGDVSTIMWENPAIVNKAMIAPRSTQQLQAEYFQAWRQFPLELAKMKWMVFTQMLNWKRTAYFVHSRTPDYFVPTEEDEPAPGAKAAKQNTGPTTFEELHLSRNEHLAPVREAMANMGMGVAASRLRWVFGVHGLWFIASIGGVLLSLRAWRQKKDGRFLVLGLVLMGALSYYLSYLPASPVEDYRFMFPSTLVAAIVILSAGAGWMTVRKSK